MKIGINALFYQSATSGSGQYMIHLLTELSRLDTQNEYVLFGPRPLPQGHQPPFPYREQAVPGLAAKNENIEKVIWEQFTAPVSARKANVDILHVPYFAPPMWPRTPTVVTILDVIPLRLPAYHPNGKVKAYFSLVARAAQRATRIITISQHAKQDIVETLHIHPSRIQVTYLAASEEYRPVTNPEKLALARKRYGLGERYIFYLGGLDQRKNVPQLVRAFARLTAQMGDTTLQLFISGNPDKKQGPLFPDPRPIAAELGIADRVICRFVDDEDKATIYSGASLFAFPSLYEGFGLDPLEAMACGTPVVCSNRTSLPEVVGNAAITVDPESVEELAAGMQQVLSNDQLQAELRQRSLQRARQFSWRKTAEETLQVYEAVYKQKKLSQQ